MTKLEPHCIYVLGCRYTWGNGSYHRTGHTSNDDLGAPKMVSNFDGTTPAKTALTVSCGFGDAHTLVVTGDNKVWSFGDRDYGKLGREGGKTPAIIQDVDAVKFVDAQCGNQFSVILSEDGDVYGFFFLVIRISSHTLFLTLPKTCLPRHDGCVFLSDIQL